MESTMKLSGRAIVGKRETFKEERGGVAIGEAERARDRGGGGGGGQITEKRQLGISLGGLGGTEKGAKMFV